MISPRLCIFLLIYKISLKNRLKEINHEYIKKNKEKDFEDIGKLGIRNCAARQQALQIILDLANESSKRGIIILIYI